jgi:branched-chain amino acid transport system substrate-binding protein
MPNADTTCADTAAAAKAADSLVKSEKVAALVGALCSGATISVAENVAIPQGITIVSPASTSPAITSLNDNDLVFRTTPSDLYQGSVMARLLRSKGIKSIAITYVNNDYGKGFADALAAAFLEAGGTIAANEPHEEGKADYRTEIRKLAASGVETLVVLAYANGSGQTIIRQALESGDFDQFVGGDGMVNNTLISAIGADKLRGMIATKPGVPDTTGARVFKKLAWGDDLNPTATFAAQSYDAAFLLALAIEKNGSAEREGLSKALRDVATAPGEVILPGEWQKAKALLKAGKDINYEGATGSIEFDKAGDVSGVIIELGVYVRFGAFIEFGQIR